MNDRIKEIGEKAGLFMERQHPGGFPNEELSVAYKFAELIVRECNRYVAEHYDECEPWMEPGDLLKHFGVKE
jgi:hypothetical protein